MGAKQPAMLPRSSIFFQLRSEQRLAIVGRLLKKKNFYRAPTNVDDSRPNEAGQEAL
jgi:hypothetical protein